MGLGGAGLLVAAIGLADDRGQVSIGRRLLVHFLAAAWGLIWLAPGWSMPSGIDGWLAAGSSLLALVWLLNLYNFMDGIDGIAGVETISVAAGAVLIWPQPQDEGLRLTLVVLAGSAAGFLIWNWAPAKIFLGDVGSGFLGLVLGLSAYAAPALGGPNLWCWMILLAVFLVDATLTLGRRMLRRERWWQPHRSHAYQRLARRWGSHSRVSLAVAAVNLLWLLPLAWAAAQRPLQAPWLALVALLPLLLAGLWAGAGQPDEVGR